jgi:hypothetical protein
VIDWIVMPRRADKGQTMRNSHCPSHILGKLFYFALIGFIVLLLAGPVIALLSVALSMALAILSFAIAVLAILLPFAVLGFLIWAPLQAAFSDKPVEWRKLGRMCKGILDLVLSMPRRAWSIMTYSSRTAHDKLSGLSGNVGIVLFETFCGAVVGFMLGVMVGKMSAPPHDEMIGPGALIGAVLGALVGVSRISTRRSEIKSQTADL